MTLSGDTKALGKVPFIVFEAPACQAPADRQETNVGRIDTPSTAGASLAIWGDYLATSVLNDTGKNLFMTEPEFPCGGPATTVVCWIVGTCDDSPVAPEGTS